MTIKLGIVMDPISAINIKKDSSFAMLEEAQKRGYELFYLEMKDLYMEAGRAFGTMRPLTVKYDYADWYSLGEVVDQRRQHHCLYPRCRCFRRRVGGL